MRPCLRVHPVPRIGDGEHDMRARLTSGLSRSKSLIQRDVGRLDRELAPVGHGVAGVHRQVHDDLLDLGRIGFHPSERRIEGRVELDVFADQPPQHLVHLGNR